MRYLSRSLVRIAHHVNPACIRQGGRDIPSFTWLVCMRGKLMTCASAGLPIFRAVSHISHRGMVDLWIASGIASAKWLVGVI